MIRNITGVFLLNFLGPLNNKWFILKPKKSLVSCYGNYIGYHPVFIEIHITKQHMETFIEQLWNYGCVKGYNILVIFYFKGNALFF